MKKSRLLFAVLFAAMFAFGIAASCSKNEEKAKLLGISVQKRPIRITYEVNEELWAVGGKLMLMYSDNTNVELSMEEEGVTFEYSFDSLGPKTVTVKYKGFQTTFQVTIVEEVEDVLVNIDVLQMPTKIEYMVNEPLDTTGGKVKLIYSRSAPGELDMSDDILNFDYDFAKKDNASVVTIRYGTEDDVGEATFTVKVTTPPEPDNYGTGKKKAPDFTVYTLDGKTVKLSDYWGVKPVFITFWATWCGPCKGEMPHFDKVYEEFDGEFEILAISDETLSTITNFSKGSNGKDLDFPLLHDRNKKVYNGSWGTGALPANYMVDKWGYLYKSNNPSAKSDVTKFNLGTFTSESAFKAVIEAAIARGNV